MMAFVVLESLHGSVPFSFQPPDAVMAANPTPTNDDQLMVRVHDMVRGCQELETVIGIKQNTAEKMQAALDAAKAAKFEVGRLKKDRADRRTDFREMDREAELVLGRCRLRLVMLFGVAYSSAWDAAGFPNRSTMVPEVYAERLSLLAQLAGYFASHPEHESVDMGATAEICLATRQMLTADRGTVTQTKVQLRQAVMAKNATMKTLRKRMRGLIRELDILLAPDDSRWRMFGLHVPAHEPVPASVGKVTLTALNPGMAEASWEAVPHATRYQVQSRPLGGNEFAPVETVHDTKALLSDLPSGQMIEVRVIAANEQGEASPGPSTAIAVP